LNQVFYSKKIFSSKFTLEETAGKISKNMFEEGEWYRKKTRKHFFHYKILDSKKFFPVIPNITLVFICLYHGRIIVKTSKYEHFSHDFAAGDEKYRKNAILLTIKENIEKQHWYD